MSASIKKTLYKQRVTNSGFTLVELMVTLVVLGVLAGMAAPNIATQLANQRVKSTTATLISALKEAKVESVIRRRTMEVAYKDNGSKAGTIQIKTDLSGLAPSAGPALYLIPPPAPMPDDTGTGGTGTGGTGTGGTGTGDTGTGGTGTGGTGTGDTGTGGTGTGGTGTGGTGTGGTGTGGTGTGDTGTGDTGTGGTGTIPAPIPTPDLGVIAAYRYDAKSIIQATSATVTFEANKRVTPAVTYTICDTDTSASPRQVTVSTLGLIESKTGGTCE
ncbi:prepilin-type N-terminal cleavage/methylation domain-containing protein [Psychrobacter sp. F1192]|uniref:Prepilin-type N-terminal cleavage/methylation domain-containing protein n=1 Tax=Psychrobacter coccoides TaxID=2818440 RepID=A0ABS3NR32_9GAMM|nr:prepilin-type N-terminal cleavage/methylation domain-containing protein [Psychrobacter coccoides]MBO1531882.1 prepilin-type N-terminal cleavage/methylation domain-containing protein [Psychrobacter coccoides]